MAWGVGLLWLLFQLADFALGVCPAYEPGGSARAEAVRTWAPPGLECTFTGENGNVLVQIPADYSLLAALLLVVALPTYVIAKRRLSDSRVSVT